MKEENKCYHIQWTERVGYYTHVYAKNKKEAEELFFQGEINSIEPSGYCKMTENPIEIYEEVSS